MTNQSVNQDKVRPKLDERFIMQIEGKDFVKFAGLLDLGHQIGISKIEVEPLQLPTKENGDFAICKATVVSKAGDTFIDIGDANPNNCNARIAKHLLRLASTRSISRSLRAFTNIGMTCLEELEGFDEAPGNGKKAAKVKQSRKPKQSAQPADSPVKHGKEAPGMSEAQRRAISNLSRRRGITSEELGKMATEVHGKELDYFTVAEASSFIRELQEAA